MEAKAILGRMENAFPWRSAVLKSNESNLQNRLAFGSCGKGQMNKFPRT